VESENKLTDGLHNLLRNFLKDIGELSNNLNEFKSLCERDQKIFGEELFNLQKEGEKISFLIFENEGKN
jgi:hypothetical protein